MQNENTLEDNSGTLIPTNGTVIPPIIPKNGWSTSQGQMTAIFTLVCLVLGFLGINKTPTQLDSWVATANHLVETVLPLVTGLVTLVYYIISRGKIQSNAINANATVLAAQAIGPANGTIQGEPIQAVGLMGNPFGSFKDPHTYQNLIHIAGELGVPGAHQVDAVQQKIPITDLITGILGMLHKKTKTQ